MDLGLTDEQRMIVSTVREFVRERIVPLEKELDPDSDELPGPEHARLVAIVAEMSLYCPDVPEELRGADRAAFGITSARTEKAKGRDGVTCFIIDTDADGSHVRRVIHTLRAARYAPEIQFENLRVPAENVLGPVNGGFAIARDRVA